MKIDGSTLDEMKLPPSTRRMESFDDVLPQLRLFQHREQQTLNDSGRKQKSIGTTTTSLKTIQADGGGASDICWLRKIPKSLMDPIVDNYIRFSYGGTSPAPRCLLDAMYCGDEGTAIMLLKRRDHILRTTNVDICNFRESWSQRTPLHCAIEAGRHDLALLLLEYGANGALADSLYGETALHTATRHCRNTRLSLAAHDNGDQSAHRANRRRGRELLNRNKVRRELVSHIEAKDILLARLLEKDGPRLVNMLNNRGDSALHIAASGGDAVATKLLLKYGSDVNIRDRGGCTPLMLAAGAGNLATLDVLLENGADYNCTDSTGVSALYYAYGCRNSMRRLLEYGADVNFMNGGHGTVLKVAIAHGSEESVCLLLEYGARVTLQDAQGRTALHHAVIHGRQFLLEMLLEQDSSGIDIQDSNNDTALHLAVRSEVLVRVLLDYGANAELRNGHTVRELAQKLLGSHNGVCQMLSNVDGKQAAAKVI